MRAAEVKRTGSRNVESSRVRAPPLRLRVPLLALTVPVLLKATTPLTVVVPVPPPFVKMPWLLKVPVPLSDPSWPSKFVVKVAAGLLLKVAPVLR